MVMALGCMANDTLNYVSYETDSNGMSLINQYVSN
jgi:hypothetical protein